jgi:hypothetical protein
MQGRPRGAGCCAGSLSAGDEWEHVPAHLGEVERPALQGSFSAHRALRAAVAVLDELSTGVWPSGCTRGPLRCEQSGGTEAFGDLDPVFQVGARCGQVQPVLGLDTDPEGLCRTPHHPVSYITHAIR